MIDLTWPQVVFAGMGLLVFAFVMWCFFKYGREETTYYYKDPSEEDEK